MNVEKPILEHSVRPVFPERVGFWQRWRKLILTLVAIPLVAALLIGGWLGWKFFQSVSDAANGNALGFLHAQTLKGEDRGRVNILLAGNSADDPGHGGANLTDSIMIVSIDVRNNNAYLLSIPRDLYVKIPGYGYSKINAAYAYGERDNFSASGLPDGGMGLLEQTIENTLNVPIDYYALINYAAFRDAVNAVGGIDVNIQASDPRGIYDPNININDGGPLRLSNGWQHLDGQTALNLARARNDPPGNGQRPYGLARGDFDRTQNQRLMLLALKEKIMSAGTLSNPIKVANLLDSFGNNVRTDLNTSEMRRVYDLFKAMPSSSIKSASLSDPDNKVNLIRSYRTQDGQSALIPTAGLNDYSDIQAYLDKLNGSSQSAQ